MPTDQLVEFDRGPLAGLPRPAWTRVPVRPLLAGLVGVRPRRRWRPCLDGLNDHMLADIGLRGDSRALRGLRPHEPWLLAQNLR